MVACFFPQERRVRPGDENDTIHNIAFWEGLDDVDGRDKPDYDGKAPWIAYRYIAEELAAGRCETQPGFARLADGTAVQGMARPLQRRIFCRFSFRKTQSVLSCFLGGGFRPPVRGSGRAFSSPSFGGLVVHQCHARESGHPDLAASAAALVSRAHGNDRARRTSFWMTRFTRVLGNCDMRFVCLVTHREALTARRSRPEMAPQRLEKIKFAPRNGMVSEALNPQDVVRARG